MSVHNRSIEQNTPYRSRIKWGLETGVEGKHKSRLISIQELHNFRRITHNGFTFYLSIIDTKHPKFIRITDKGRERWRMRFNVFTTGFFAQWLPNTLLHLGELHVYYDLISDRQKPLCDDFTFYYDYRKFDTEVIQYRYQMMDNAFRDSLIGRDQRMRYKLFLPISREWFSSPNKDLDEFMERQDVMLSQLEQMRADNDPTNRPKVIKGTIISNQCQYQLNRHESEPQIRGTPYQRNTYQRSINCWINCRKTNFRNFCFHLH